jgi:hypothetical protein
MASDIPPDANLRERLAAALSAKGGCEHPGGESCEPWWGADAAIPAVAAWLRDKAATLPSQPPATWRGERDLLNALADEIDPPKGDKT